MAGKRLLDSGRSFDVTHDPKYIWQDDAACAFMDPKIFYPLMRGSLEAATTSEAEVLELNEKNFEQARKACASCPVFDQCEAETTDDDRKFVFRAGKVPTSYSGLPVGRPKKKRQPTYKVKPTPPLSKNQIEFNQRLKAAGGDHSLMSCTHGHVGGYCQKLNGRWGCRECARLLLVRARSAQAEQRKKLIADNAAISASVV